MPPRPDASAPNDTEATERIGDETAERDLAGIGQVWTLLIEPLGVTGEFFAEVDDLEIRCRLLCGCEQRR